MELTPFTQKKRKAFMYNLRSAGFSLCNYATVGKGGKLTERAIKLFVLHRHQGAVACRRSKGYILYEKMSYGFLEDMV